MKKTISVIAAAALALTCTNAAFAESRTANIMNALGQDEIHIIYNDTPVTYEDVKPVNTEGRVMIPFRAALESMGATVEYDDATRHVTASKGTKTIDFTLMDDTINVDDNGEKSTVTMDVPMIIVEDRTLVPIRFMSNALGMQVGWDGDTETVVIADYDEYFANVDSLIPNIKKLQSIESDDFDVSIADVEVSSENEGTTTNFKGSATVSDKNGASVDGTMTVANGGETHEMPTKFIYKDGTVYFNFDVGEEFDVPITADQWYSLNIADMFSEQAADLMQAASQSDSDIEAMLKSMVTTEGDAQFRQITNVAATLDAMEYIDKCVKIEEKDNGSTASVELDKKGMEEFLGYSLDMYDDVTIKASVDYTDEQANSTLEFSFALTGGQKVTAKVTAVSKKGEGGEEITAPENAQDIAELMQLISDLNGLTA